MLKEWRRKAALEPLMTLLSWRVAISIMILKVIKVLICQRTSVTDKMWTCIMIEMTSFLKFITKIESKTLPFIISQRKEKRLRVRAAVLTQTSTKILNLSNTNRSYLWVRAQTRMSKTFSRPITAHSQHIFWVRLPPHRRARNPRFKIILSYSPSITLIWLNSQSLCLLVVITQTITMRSWVRTPLSIRTLAKILKMNWVNVEAKLLPKWGIAKERRSWSVNFASAHQSKSLRSTSPSPSRTLRRRLSA